MPASPSGQASSHIRPEAPMGSFGAGHNAQPSSTGSYPQPPGGNVPAFIDRPRDAQPIRTSALNAESPGTGQKWPNQKPPQPRWEQTGRLPPVARIARSTPGKVEVRSAGSRFSYARVCIRRRSRQSKAGRPSRLLDGWCDGTWPELAFARPATTRLADQPTTPAPRGQGSQGQSLDRSPDRCSSRNWTDQARARLRQTPHRYCPPRVVSLQVVQPRAGASDSPVAGSASGRLVTESSDAVSRVSGPAGTRLDLLRPRRRSAPAPFAVLLRVAGAGHATGSFEDSLAAKGGSRYTRGWNMRALRFLRGTSSCTSGIGGGHEVLVSMCFHRACGG